MQKHSSNPPFQFNKGYDITAHEFTSVVAEKLNEVRNIYISSDNISFYSHGVGWETNYPNSVNNNGEFKKVSAETAMKFEDVVLHDVSVLQNNIDHIAKAMADQFQRSLFEMVSKTTEKTGNTLSAKDFSSNAEAFLASLKQVEFGVDKNGEVSLPSFYVGKEMSQKMLDELQSMGPEFDAKVQKIKQEKTQKALAEEIARKSKFAKPENSH